MIRHEQDDSVWKCLTSNQQQCGLLHAHTFILSHRSSSSSRWHVKRKTICHLSHPALQLNGINFHPCQVENRLIWHVNPYPLLSTHWLFPRLFSHRFYAWYGFQIEWKFQGFYSLIQHENLKKLANEVRKGHGH